MADTLTVRSSMFDDGGTIPPQAAHGAAGGENVSPDLTWEGAPEGTRGYAVTCWDPDAPTGVGFVHWLLFDIPAGTTSLPVGAGSDPGATAGTHGHTDWGQKSYGGMAPPPGDDAHEYQFTVYALDTDSTGLSPDATYAQFRFMTREHVLATGTLRGRFAAG